jgi:uncharacterized membrane protein
MLVLACLLFLVPQTSWLIFKLQHSFGGVHTRLGIELSTQQTLFVYLIIIIAPIVAGILVWTRYVSISLWVFFLAMLGSFLFGVYNHYVLVSPDNIRHLPLRTAQSHSHFVTSAAVIAVIELASAVYGAFCLARDYGQTVDRLL